MDIVMTALLPCCRHVLRVGAHDQPVLACTLMCDDSYTRVAPAKFFGVGVKTGGGCAYDLVCRFGRGELYLLDTR